MQKEIFIDVLTQVFNRQYLYSHLPQLLEKAEKEKFPVGMLMIDVDNFKRINDDFGHLTGDKVLKKLAEILKKNLRDQDKVIRYAGDEFIIVVENGEISYLKKIASRLKEEVEKAEFENNIKCTISIGIARYPQDAKSLEDLIELADQALYFSKRKGKNRLYLISEVRKEEITLKLAKTLFPCKKFIGREKEILEAKRFFDKALSEYKPHCFFVKGVQGIGKSRFLNQINNYFKNKCFYFSSVGDKEKIKVPYYLIAEAIENFIKQQKRESIKEIISSLSPQAVNQLLPLFPQLKEILEVTSPQEKINLDQRFFLFKAFRDLILAFLRKRAVLISFDNLHYADIATLELIYYFLKSPHQLPLLINGAYISQGLKGTEIPLLEILSNFRREERFKEMTLERFNREEIKEMVETIFPGLLFSEKFIEKIEKSTSGNPFFVEEILKLLIEENIIVYQENKWQLEEKAEKLDFSFSIEEIMKRKLSKLDPEVKEILFEAALIGQRFDVKTLSKMHNRDEGYILDILEKAKSMHLISEDVSGGSFYFNFVNPLIKETISIEAEKADIKGKIETQKVSTSLSKYQKLLQEFSENISSQDIEKYLEELSLEEPFVEEIHLDSQTIQEIYELIRLMVTSIKNIRLFPPTNSVRINLLKKTLQLLRKILDKVERLNFEVVEGKLFVNGKVFSKKEGSYLYVDYFLSLLKEFNISSIGIHKDVQEQEFNLFLEGLSFPPQEIIFEGGWSKFLKDMIVTHIKIKESYKEKVRKERMKDVMLLDYLVGKSLNKDYFLEKLKESPEEIAYLLKMLSSQEVSEEKFKIIKENIAQIVEEIKGISASEEYLGKLRKLASLLESPVREKVFSEEIEKEILPSTEKVESVNIMDLVEKEFVESKGSVLSLRNVVKNNLKNITREEIHQVFQKLKDLGIDEELCSFIVGDISFKEVKIDKKIKIIEDISSYDESLLDEEILRDTFTELLNLKNDSKLLHTLRTIFLKIEEGVVKEKARFLNFLVDITNSTFFGGEEKIPFFISVLLKAILTEKEVVLRNIFYLLSYIVKEINYRLNQSLNGENLKYYTFMVKLLEIIKKRREEEKDEVLHKEIEGWLSEFYSKKFIENTLLLFEKFIDSKEAEDLKRMIINLKDTPSFLYLIELAFQEKEEKDFESFIKRRKLFIVLEKIKDSLSKEIFNLVKRNEIVITKDLIQFLVYIKEIKTLEEIYFSVLVTPQLKEEIISSLGKITSFDAKEMLERICREEKNKRLKILAERILKKK